MALVERGLAPSREKAQALIMAGAVYSGERRIEKPSWPVEEEAALEVRSRPHPFVSRGGLKLRGGLDAFETDPSGQVCADIGASTGGFTHCLLLAGARLVYAVDVGKGLIDASLREDPRVVLMEEVNARHLEAGAFPESPSLVTIDASFISLRLILPAVLRAAPGAEVIALVKPQFEVGRGRVGKGGIVRDEAVREGALAGVGEAAAALGYRLAGTVRSPVTGSKGNVEYLIHLIPPAGAGN